MSQKQPKAPPAEAEAKSQAQPEFQRPSREEALAKLKGRLESQGRPAAGSVINRRRDQDAEPLKSGEQPFFTYYWLDPRAPGADEVRERRKEEGFWLAEPGAPERVPECTRAEIWMTYAFVGAAIRQARRVRFEEGKAAVNQQFILAKREAAKLKTMMEG